MPASSAAAPSLGEFETVVLMAVLHLVEREQAANGSAVREEIAARAGRQVAPGAVYVTLDRLEAKGLLASRLGQASHVRDHKPKRLFRVTPAGLRAVQRATQVFNRMQAGLRLDPVLSRGLSDE
jgi:DNA-binding PadR family transcriptional regulator